MVLVGRANKMWEAPVKVQRTSHSDLAVALRGVKIGLWSPVDAV